MTNEELLSQFESIENAFNEAVVSNNTTEIAKCISGDWILIDAHGGIVQRESFFNAVEKGLLTHATMTKKILRVKVYNEIALVTGRGQNTGTWMGQPIGADEWITDVYKKQNGYWICVLTHLTPVKK